MSDKLIIKSRKGYKLTDVGMKYVTELLEEGGYFSEIDFTGFEANAMWAGILATHMVEAAHRYLSEMGKRQKEVALDPDEESELAIVALYAAVAHQQVKDSLPPEKERGKP